MSEKSKAMQKSTPEAEATFKELIDLEVHTSADTEVKGITETQAKEMYKNMEDIRNFEENVRRFFAAGEIPGFVHLYAGEEAIATGVCSHLTEEDFITSTHRGHGHCIAKGGDLKQMMAEIFGKETGLGKGKGGSMHIADLDKGILGANGMVGGGFGIATGAAMRNKYKENDSVVICFFGDGAANEGLFHESLNMASIWKLPVVFVNENNFYAEATPQWYASASKTIAERAAAYDMPGIRVNGKDIAAVYDIAGEAIERARKGEGPTLIECVTYRNYGHFEGDDGSYKARSGEEKEWADVDPLDVFRKYAVESDLIKEDELDKLREESKQQVEEAVEFAKESPEPKAETLYDDVFVD